MAIAKIKLDERDWDEAARISKITLSNTETMRYDERGHASHYLGESHFRRAFETGTREEFEREMQFATENLESSGSLFEKAGLKGSQNRAKSRALYSQFWLEKRSDARRDLVAKCVALGEEAAQIFAREQDKDSSAETKAELLSYLRSSNELANNYATSKELFEKAAQTGREAITELTALNRDNIVLEVLYNTFWILGVHCHIVVEWPKTAALVEEAAKIASKLSEVASRVGTPYASLLNSHVSGDVAWEIEGDPGRGIQLYQQAVALSDQVKDNLIRGRLYWVLLIAALWQGMNEEYTENRRAIVEKCIGYGKTAIEKLEIPYCTSNLSGTYAHLADCHLDIALTSTAGLETRRTMLRNAIQIASKGLDLEAGTWGSDKIHHVLSKTIFSLATITDKGEERSNLVKEALRVREKELEIVDRLEPYGWDRGIARMNRSMIKSELAGQESDLSVKTKLLTDAVQDLKDCLEICKERNNPGHAKLIARYSERYGDALVHLHRLTGESEVAGRAIGAFEESAALWESTGQASLQGALNWKIATVRDATMDFQNANLVFSRAASNYRLAAQKLPGAADTLRDLAVYMDAWACVEKARLNHDDEKFSAASLEYDKASNMLQATRTWNHLSKHYSACSLIEKGEAASRREKLVDSSRAFKDSSETFKEAKTKLEMKLQNSFEPQERTDLSEWIKISDERTKYALARSLLEEARALDKQDENERSARLYVEASESFAKLSALAEKGNRDELRTMMLFCKAGAEMKEAELKSSPQRYKTASEMFHEAAQTTRDEKLQALANANSHISTALATGARFRETKDRRLYPKIKDNLEAARELYDKAGFDKAENWALATQRFYDAISYLADGQREKSVSRKRELFHIAERTLDSASRLYSKSGFKGREGEARKLLQRAKEEGELSAPLLSLAGTRTAFEEMMPIALLKDQPLGLARFEAANVVGTAKIAERVLKLGMTTTVQIELTNAGRTLATLVRLEGVPPEGMEVDREKLQLPLEDGFVDLKGRRLEHAKSYTLQLVLKGSRRGVFELRPRIAVADQSGNIGISELEPTAIIVEGPLLPENFQTNTAKRLESRTFTAPKEWFETERARDVFQHLAKEFLTDYMAKGLNAENAGWRTMMRIVQSLKIPRSTFYAPQGRDGAILSELDRRGIVERRVFPERGRGGAITKLRVAYETPAVRAFLRKAIVESL